MLSSLGSLVKHAFRGAHGASQWKPEFGKFTELKATGMDGKDVDFKSFDGRVALITNVACFCGYTEDGYTNMVALHKKYKDKGLSVLAFPCNQFGAQEPGTEEDIKKFLGSKYKPEFDMFRKIDVNGPKTHPVYGWLKRSFPGDVTWNFSSKFLINKDGIPIARFEKEAWEVIDKAIADALAAPRETDKPEDGKQASSGSSDKPADGKVDSSSCSSSSSAPAKAT